MSPPIAFLLLFVVLGIFDKFCKNRFGLAEELDKGLSLMGSLSLSMSGIYCFAVLAGRGFAQFIETRGIGLPFDLSIISSSFLSTSMGAYSIAEHIAPDPLAVIFSGVLFSSMLGSSISFSLPVAMETIPERELPKLMQGMVFGVIAAFPTLVVGGLVLRMPAFELVKNLLPVAAICILLCFGIFRAKRAVMMLFSGLGTGIQYLCYLLFLGIIAQTFFSSLELIPPELISEIIVIVFKTSTTICGSFILSKLVLKYFMRPLLKLAGLMGINEYSIIGLLLNLVTSVSMFTIFDRMDRRGQVMNGACMVTSAYVLGGHLAFVADVNPGSVPVFFLCKFLGGLLSILIVSFLIPREELAEDSIVRS